MTLLIVKSSVLLEGWHYELLNEKGRVVEIVKCKLANFWEVLGQRSYHR